MNGVSVYPGQKTQNAPTWQVENQGRGGCFFAHFYPFFIFEHLPPHEQDKAYVQHLLAFIGVTKL